MDGAPACPFVAFGDDREARSTSPDHRHRCFAETPPAPRAVAHQEAYCLSSAFPVCPTFQDWARREAAQARAAGDRPPASPPPAATPEPRPYDLYADWAIPPPPASPPPGPGRRPGRRAGPSKSTARLGRPAAVGHRRGDRRRHVGAIRRARDAARAAGAGPAEPPPSRPVEGQGLAGSPADRLAAGEVPAAVAWSASAGGHASTAPDEELAGLVQGRRRRVPRRRRRARHGHDTSVPAAALAAAAAAASASPPPPSAPEPIVRSGSEAYPPSTRTGKRPAVSSTRDVVAGPVVGTDAARSRPIRPIKSGSSTRGMPRVAVFAGALGIAALILFMLPAIIGIGGGGTSERESERRLGRPRAPAWPRPSSPAPTPVVYVIKKGDTLSKVANRFDVELEDLLAANPDIKDPNKISLGQEIIIPSASAAPPAASEEPGGVGRTVVRRRARPASGARC